MSFTWLVTGSAGFIGSNLASRLLRRGDNVIGIDNLSAGKQSNVDRVMAESKGAYTFVKGDICNKDDVAKCFDFGVDAVVHLAAQGSVQKSFVDVAYNNRQNIDGYLNVLTASGERGVSQFIYASSCAIYGDTDVLPIDEKQCPDPVSPYASSKLLNDLLGKNLSSQYPNMTITGLRFFNIFGPWQDPDGDYAAVIPKWIDLCVAGKQPIIFGDGSATRDFCYVGNICDLIENIGSSEAGALESGVYNIASQTPTSLNDLFAAVTTGLTGKGVSIHFDKPDYKPWRDGDIVHSMGSIGLVREKLGFEPKVDLKQGIEMILSEQYGF